MHISKAKFYIITFQEAADTVKLQWLKQAGIMNITLSWR